MTADFTKNFLKLAQGQVPDDKSLQRASPGDKEIRSKYQFANILFEFVGRGNYITLPAYLTSFDNNFSADWKTNSSYGRSDPIAIYDKTIRSISLSFTIPSYDSNEANINYRKINELAKNLYPSYAGVGGVNILSGERNRVLTSPPLVRIKFANLIVNNEGIGLLGRITRLSITHDVNSGFLFENTSYTQPNIYTKFFTISISFDPMHEQPLGYNSFGAANFGGEQWAGNSSDFPYKNGLTSIEQNKFSNVSKTARPDDISIEDEILGG